MEDSMGLNCYHFNSQDVFLTQRSPSAFSSSQDKLFIAYNSPQNVIQVLDVAQKDGALVADIPTLSAEVNQLVFCEEGNYIATLGKKIDECRQVVVYFNWWLKEQPQKSRKAGDSSSVLKDAGHEAEAGKPGSVFLEAVDLPLDEVHALNARWIACCQKTGNICLNYGKFISIYQLTRGESHQRNCWGSHDFSRVIDIRINFLANQVDFCENFLVFASNNHVQVIQLLLDNEEIAIDCKKKKIKKGKKETTRRSHDIGWDFGPKDRSNSKLLLPSLFGDYMGSDGLQLGHAFKVIGPASDSIACPVKVKLIPGFSEVHSMSRATVNLLLCRYFPQNETVINANLSPFYYTGSKDKTSDPLNVATAFLPEKCSSNPLISTSNSCLKFCGCFISSETRGYFYSLHDSVQEMINFGYEATAKSVILDGDVCHILTDSGLKVYSLGVVFSPSNDLLSSSGPLLINCSQFLSTSRLLNTTYNLLLLTSPLTSPDNVNRTVYSLKKPSLTQLHADFMETLSFPSSQERNFRISLMTHLLTLFKNSQTYQEDQLTLLRKTGLLLVKELLAGDEGQVSVETLATIFESAQLTVTDLCHDLCREMDSQLLFDVLRLKIMAAVDIMAELKSQSSREFIFSLVAKKEPALLDYLILKSTMEPLRDQLEVMFKVIESVSADHEKLLKAKVYFDCNETTKASQLLSSERKGTVLQLLLRVHGQELVFSRFLEFVSQSSPEALMQFLVAYFSKYKGKLKESIASAKNQSPLFLPLLLDLSCFLFKVEPNEALKSELAVAYYDCLSGKSDGRAFQLLGETPRLPSWLKLLPPYHEDQLTLCLCNKCSLISAKLQLLLCSDSSGKTKRAISHLLNEANLEDNQMSYKLSILVKEPLEAIDRLQETHPEAVIVYCLDFCKTDVKKWKKVVPFIDRKVYSEKGAHLDENLSDCFLLQLSDLLDPAEFASLLPVHWKNAATPYFKRCYAKYQANQLKLKIVNLGNELKSMLL